RLDYWSAALAIMFGLYISIARVFRLHVASPSRGPPYSNGHANHANNQTSNHHPDDIYFDTDPDMDPFTTIYTTLSTFIASLNPFSSIPPQLALWRAFCLLLYIFHVTYLALLPRFDYSYNVIACAIVGALSQLAWLFFAWRERHREYAWRGAVLALGVTLAMSLELGDFPPIGWAVDAHALWHLATVPIGVWWYGFAERDVVHETRKGKEAVR
ncbi:hypothetical protein HDU93_010109, partial [Gonapodya sp. JEL0774]